LVRFLVISLFSLLLLSYLVFFFFFQAEDGIRDFHVTGVQTCALPISLQQLADEGLITAEELGGRKTYSLTDAGIAASEEAAEKTAPWEAAGHRSPSQLAALPKAGMELASATAQLARTGSPEQVQEGVAVLEDARRRLYAILAEG